VLQGVVLREKIYKVKAFYLQKMTYKDKASYGSLPIYVYMVSLPSDPEKCSFL